MMIPCPSTNILSTPSSLNTTAMISVEVSATTASSTPDISNTGLLDTETDNSHTCSLKRLFL